jgi:hypothetical protein
MALTPAAMGTCVCALGTGEPCCVGRPTRLFFMFEANSPEGAVRHAVVARAALLVGR